MSVTGPSHLRSVKPRMERGEWPVPVAAAWHAGILYPDTSSMPRPSSSSSTAQAGESETLLLRCLARQDPAAVPRQPPTRLLLFYARLGPAQPSTTAKLVQARGRIATPMCYITIISAPSPATEPWASTPTFILTLIHYFSKSQFASLLYDSAYHQSNILCHCTGRYLDI